MNTVSWLISKILEPLLEQQYREENRVILELL